MKRVKGCLNSGCTAYKKTFYKESDEYCPKCGSQLSYVCRNPKCFKQIPADIKESYCPVHLAERQDEKEKRNKTFEKIGICVATVGSLAVAVGKLAVDKIKKK